MVLTSDAETANALEYDISKKKLNKDVLQKIEGDLDIDEAISILFLITKDYMHAFQEIYGLLQKFNESQKLCVLTEFINNHPDNWEERLLEAICIIQNRQIVRKLGILFSDLELMYIPKNRLYSRNLNPVAKCLYMLCEACTEKQMKLLLQYVNAELREHETNLDDVQYLELHMLYWMQKNYISIYSDGRVNLKNLLVHLKKFDDMDLIYENLRRYENHQNVLDTYNETVTNRSQLRTFSLGEGTQSGNSVKEDLVKVKKGLCIIISQMYFHGNKFENRYGTTADCKELTETFRGFGFDVILLENLNKCEMLEKMENISKEYGTNYDCIFVCILSHGYKGGIIATDEQQVSIEMIEQKICCIELKDVIKVVVIQACQGEVAGQVKNPLTTDGPTNSCVSDILPYRNFCIFMSTMQGFVSVRHKAQGSWFIQEFCSVLRNQGNALTFLQLVRRVIQTVEKKRGKLDGNDSIAQLPELRSCRLLNDFQLPKYSSKR